QTQSSEAVPVRRRAGISNAIVDLKVISSITVPNQSWTTTRHTKGRPSLTAPIRLPSGASPQNESTGNTTLIPWQTHSHSVAKPKMRAWQSSSAAAGGVSTGEAHVAAAVADRHVAAVGAHRCVAHVLLEGQVLDVRTRCRGGGRRGGVRHLDRTVRHRGHWHLH